VLALLLVHDLLLAKKGIALPATHGLRASIERHKARLQAELTKARLRRKAASMELLRTQVESGGDGSPTPLELPHPRWVRVNTLKTSLSSQLSTLFASYEQVSEIAAVQERGTKRLFIDPHIPNLVAIPSHTNTELIKSSAYKNGEIIFQDKASCFPAYLIAPSLDDGDFIDSCAAPGNKTTHLAAISREVSGSQNASSTIHAFEKNKIRAETLKKMTDLAGSGGFTKIHAGQDFMRVDPNAEEYANVTALLLDPSCSGSGIVGRDDMPALYLPSATSTAPVASKSKSKKASKLSKPDSEPPNGKRKRDSSSEEDDKEMMVDDDGIATPVTAFDLQTRLESLSSFQLSLLLHSFSFPAAQRITYSTCSIHYEENESVVFNALKSRIARDRGWRVLRRDEQVEGMKKWDVRGELKGDEKESLTAWRRGKDDDNNVIKEACIRARKGDGRGTMGFFVAAFVRDEQLASSTPPLAQQSDTKESDTENMEEDDEEWGGFSDEGEADMKQATAAPKVATVTEQANPSGDSKKKKKKQKTG
jgi:putative methyltransferase